MAVVHLLGEPGEVWSVGGLVWETCGKTVGFSTELPHVREAKSTDCPHGIRPPWSSYLPTHFSEEPENEGIGKSHFSNSVSEKARDELFHCPANLFISRSALQMDLVLTVLY